MNSPGDRNFRPECGNFAVILDPAGQFGKDRFGVRQDREPCVVAFKRLYEALRHAVALRAAHRRKEHRQSERARCVGGVSGDKGAALSESHSTRCGGFVALSGARSRRPSVRAPSRPRRRHWRRPPGDEKRGSGSESCAAHVTIDNQLRLINAAAASHDKMS